MKRKIENGEFVLLCLPDENKMHIEKAKDDFFQNSNDLVQNSTSKKSGNSKSASFKKAFSEYDENSHKYKVSTVSNIPQVHQYSLAERLVSSPHISPGQPPDHS